MMSKFESMSDFELSAEVAQRKFHDILNISQATESAVEIIFINGQRLLFSINSWADMGSILELIWDNLLEPIECEQGCNMIMWEYYKIKTGSTTKAAAIIYLESLENSND